MAFLELSPMIVALRDRPADFEVDRGWLTHFPSRHRFKFDREGNLILRAHCECARLSARPEQAQELWAAFLDWRASYWRSIEINREFAAHFRRPNILQRAFRRALAKARLVLLDPTLDQEPTSAVADRAAIANS
jgi:hypothetical protein